MTDVRDNLDMRNITALPSGNYRVRIEHQGEVLSGVVASHPEALELRDELKRQIVDGELAPTKGKTPKDLGPHFLGSRNGNRDAGNEASRWKHIARAAWARKALAAVTRADGSAWLRVLKKTRVSFDPEKHGERENKFLGWQTRKHCLNLARAFFDWAIEQEVYGITTNPFRELIVEKEDGDEDEGYQEGWYLDGQDQPAFFAMWDRRDIGLDLDEGDRMEKWIVMVAAGAGFRKREQWCLHLTDVHVGRDEKAPRVEVRFGSWDPVKQRYRPPKGRKGEKKKRTVYLHGMALEAMRAWLALLPIYAPKNPLGLAFPTERGARRSGNPRSWKKVVDAFGVIPRIGRKVWWHLLRHTCASSMISGWWGMRWSLKATGLVLGHTSVKTTEIYAHLAPSAMQETAVQAQAAYAGSRHGAVTAQRPAARSTGKDWHARQDSNLRHSASKADALSS
jgi:integrase